jgi:D-glycero-D-manno-heptose 1,7-bisphosphate phosphatase
MNKIVFLDRDGVINVNRRDYVKSREEFIFLPFVLEAIKLLNQNDFSVMIISNQSAIGRGIITEEILLDIHQKMLKLIQNAGGTIEKIYYCPHKPSDDCHCRKPKPGMFLQAKKEFDIDLKQTYFVGDNITDFQAAQNADCKFIFVDTGMYDREDIKPYNPEFIAGNLLEAAEYIIDNYNVGEER